MAVNVVTGALTRGRRRRPTHSLACDRDVRYERPMWSPDEAGQSHSVPNGPGDAAAGLAESARGWHRIQLAVLGFVGLCGALWGGDGSAAPTWLQAAAGVLVVLAFALACLAILLVGRVAYRFEGQASPAAPIGDPAGASRQLRRGVRITYVALAVLVSATLVAWWPSADDTGTVEVSDASGRTWCGRLGDAPSGVIGLVTENGPIGLRLDGITQIRQVSSC